MTFAAGDRVRFEPRDFCQGVGREGTVQRPYHSARGLRWVVEWDTPQKRTQNYAPESLFLLNEDEFDEDLK